jgi:hypothetical protein
MNFSFIAKQLQYIKKKLFKMLLNYSRIWFLVFYVTIFPEIKRAIRYTYINQFCIHNKTNEKVADHMDLKLDKNDIIRNTRNFYNLPTRRSYSTNEIWQLKRSASRYIYDLFQKAVDKNQGNIL